MRGCGVRVVPQTASVMPQMTFIETTIVQNNHTDIHITQNSRISLEAHNNNTRICDCKGAMMLTGLELEALTRLVTLELYLLERSLSFAGAYRDRHGHVSVCEIKQLKTWTRKLPNVEAPHLSQMWGFESVSPLLRP